MTYPSPAERYYFDTLHRHQAEAQIAAQQLAAAQQLVSAQEVAASHLVAFSQQQASSGGGTMNYVEKVFALGDVHIDETTPDRVFSYEIPYEFGTTLSLTVQVQAGHEDADERGGAYLWFWLTSSLDGRYWHQLKPIGENGYALLTEPYLDNVLRLHGPFTNRFAAKFMIRDSNQYNSAKLLGRWTAVALRFGLLQS